MSRLEELKSELATVFGRYTKWRVRCKDHNAISDADQIRVAEEVLREPCTGTVAEWQCHSLALQGVASVDLDDFLGHQPSGFSVQTHASGHTVSVSTPAKTP